MHPSVYAIVICDTMFFELQKHLSLPLKNTSNSLLGYFPWLTWDWHLQMTFQRSKTFSKVPLGDNQVVVVLKVIKLTRNFFQIKEKVCSNCTIDFLSFFVMDSIAFCSWETFAQSKNTQEEGTLWKGVLCEWNKAIYFLNMLYPVHIM